MEQDRRYQRDAKYFENSFVVWNLQHNRHGEISDYVEHFMKVPCIDPKVSGRMLRLSREAMHLTLDSVAKKLGIRQSALSRIEKSEARGNIKIKTLANVANALDCELVYCLRPKSRITFARGIWNLVYQILNENPKMRGRDISIREFAITANRVMEHPQFRKQMKWNQRGPVSDGGVTRMIIKMIAQRYISDN